MLAGGKLNDEFLDECRHILVRDDFAFPFLDIECGLVYLDFKIRLHFDLTAETPVVFYLFAGEVDSLGGKDVSAA